MGLLSGDDPTATPIGGNAGIRERRSVDLLATLGGMSQTDCYPLQILYMVTLEYGNRGSNTTTLFAWLSHTNRRSYDKSIELLPKDSKG